MSGVLPIRQNSTDKVSIGLAVSISDGYTLLTTLALSTADSARAKLGDDTTVDISGYTWAATTNMDGEYDLTLQTGISDTIGPMTIVIEDVSLCLPIRQEFYVYDPTVYDALFADTPTMITAKDIGIMREDVILTVTSQTEFIMTTAIAIDDAWIGLQVTLDDDSSGEIYAGTAAGVGIWITDVVSSTKSIHISSAFPVTVVSGDKLRVHKNQHPTYALNAYDPPTRAELTADTDSILSRLRGFFRLALRKDAAVTTDQVVELTELNADDGTGAGAYNNSTDSLEARADTVDDVNIATVNNTGVTGDGSDLDPWNPV